MEPSRISYCPTLLNLLMLFSHFPPSRKNTHESVCGSVHACTTGCAWSPPPISSEDLSVRRMWDKSICHSFWSCCCLSMQKCTNTCRTVAGSSGLAVPLSMIKHSGRSDLFPHWAEYLAKRMCRGIVYHDACCSLSASEAIIEVVTWVCLSA